MGWAKVAERYGLQYQGQSMTSEDGINFELNVSRGNLSKDSKMESVGPKLKDHIYENFLQVLLLQSFFLLAQKHVKIHFMVFNQI
jgi:hypothetical protein